MDVEHLRLLLERWDSWTLDIGRWDIGLLDVGTSDFARWTPRVRRFIRDVVRTMRRFTLEVGRSWTLLAVVGALLAVRRSDVVSCCWPLGRFGDVGRWIGRTLGRWDLGTLGRLRLHVERWDLGRWTVGPLERIGRVTCGHWALDTLNTLDALDALDAGRWTSWKRWTLDVGISRWTLDVGRKHAALLRIMS